MKLTFDQAVEEHRKMWNWISEKLKYQECSSDFLNLKKFYIAEYFPTEEIESSCFCCEYLNNICIKNPPSVCESCPIIWPGGNCTANSSPYDLLSREPTIEKAVTLAKEISNLPQREKRDYDL